MNLQLFKTHGVFERLDELLSKHISDVSTKQRVLVLLDRHSLDCQEMIVELATLQMKSLFKPGLWPALKTFYKSVSKSSYNTDGLELSNQEYVDETVPEEIELVDISDKIRDVIRRNVYDVKDTELVSVFFDVEPINMEGLKRMCSILQSSGKASDSLTTELMAAVKEENSSSSHTAKIIKFDSPEENEEDDEEETETDDED